MENKITCPRRIEDLGSQCREEGLDSWIDREGYDCCNYCGSLKPENLFELIEQGCEIGPTDKNYKIYVTVLNPNAGKPSIRTSSNRPQEGWIKLTSENRKDLPPTAIDNGWWVKVEPDTQMLQKKFYFQHFSEVEKQKFIDLLNQHKIKIGYPGYFYTRPFFVARKSDKALGM